MSDIISSIGNDRTMKNLEKSLDGTAKRQKIIANNIANVDTPNFKRSDIPFAEQLKRSIDNTSGPVVNLATTNSKHIPVSSDNDDGFVVSQENNLIFRNDGNNVDIEKESVEMAKNSMMYDTSAQLLSSKISKVKRAIQEGK